MATKSSTKLPAAVRKILARGRPAPMPQDLPPMLASLVTAPPEEEGWRYEMKWDGYRALAYLNSGGVQLRSRNNKSFNEKYYPLVTDLGKWKVNALIDGEIVVVNAQGIPDFANLQLWRSEADGHLLYYAFDLLWLEGVSVMDLPIEDRRALLKAIAPRNLDTIRISESLEDGGKAAFAQADSLHLEGVMAKRVGSVYQPGERSKDWLKIKTEKHQELVIGGYTRNEGTNKLFSALLMGLIENGAFQFVTPVGTGFDRKLQAEILRQLQPHIIKKSPFANEVEYNKPSRFRPHPPKAEVTWVKPVLVGEISYRELTSHGAIRQPSFRGLRPDKNPGEVVREVALPAELSETHAFVEKKLLAAPGRKDRGTLVNPKEETQTRPINGREVKFTNLSKVFWPKEGYTKRELINYYYGVAPYMLPYMKDRPQILHRHPHGITGESFYQKDVKGKAPAWIETFPYYSYMDRRDKEFLVCTDEASLLYIASLGSIEMNPWHSRKDRPDHPDWCIIDLDPDGNPFSQVIRAAQVTREVLDAVGVPSWPKTSGSTGLHIYIPLGAKYTYEDSKEFGRRLARVIHAEIPKFTSIERETKDRKGCLYIDFLMNRPQASVAAPYSLRPKPNAPVSTPLHWDEVGKGLKTTNFHMKNTMERLKAEGDLFKGVLGKGINMKQAIRKLEGTFKVLQEDKKRGKQ